MRKISLLLAAGAGYVLGARAGRERYDQIVAQAKKVTGRDLGRGGPGTSGVRSAEDDITGTYSTTPSGNHVDVDETVAWTTSTDTSGRR
ncbi:hypothetical protein KV102_12330 [Mumia sp. zg.B53]|uniref:hypothetical protein n=1 Tax=unclassified Mumia TaxID=2621872 RepID=UPI001C6E697A|nr:MULTISPECIES: hypothetical protein [unclassified Mumia]MBW9215628.1 hypothetical protein [Mumia sp. zg.B53]MDD9347884.1 hypothetical protein [Mumia sp.]